MPEIGPFLYLKLKPGQKIPMNLDRRSHRTMGEWLVFNYDNEDPRYLEFTFDSLRDNGYEVDTGMAMTLDSHYDDPTLY